MKTAIVTDTNSGMSVKEGRQRGIYVLPMPVIIDGESYLEWVNISHKEVYDFMASGKDVSTSQPAPGEVLSMWQKAVDDGAEEIVHIPMSSGLSSSCNTARLLADQFPAKVYVVDNHRISLTLYEAVRDAKYLADQGKSGQEIADHLLAEAYDASIYITVNSIDFLKKSGRITEAGVRLASFLNIKPILTIQGGKLDAYEKVRGMRIAVRHMMEAIRSDLDKMEEKTGTKHFIVGAAGTLRTIEEINELSNRIREEFPDYRFVYQPLSCSIACHIGPDAIGVGFVRYLEERKK